MADGARQIFLAATGQNRGKTIEERTNGRYKMVMNEAIAMPGAYIVPRGNPAGRDNVMKFIAQALQLHHAPRHPEVLATTTRIAIANLAKIGALESREAEGLIAAERLWRGISGILRLTLGPWREETLPEPAASAVLRVAGPLCATPPVDLPGLRAQMEESAALVRQVFEDRLGRLDQGNQS